MSNTGYRATPKPPMTDEARDLAGRNVDICARLAARHHRRFFLDPDEATSIAMEALCYAASAYVGKKDPVCRFITYAINGIVHAFGDSLKHRSRFCRDRGRCVSLDDDRYGFPIPDVIGQDDDPAEPEAESSRRFEALLSVLPDRDAQVLRAFYADPNKAPGSGNAGRSVGSSRQWAWTIHKRAIARLRSLASSPGILSTKPLIVRETLEV